MDSNALNELIAQVRGTTAMLAEAEQRVDAFRTELSRQKPTVQFSGNSSVSNVTPLPKRARFGWLPTGA
jgi:hypothetical protein